MRAYLALIKDSFREAMASKVLWILLILISIFFLSLAPLGFEEQLRTRFDFGDVDNGPALIASMMAAAEEETPSPAGRVWSLLPKTDQEKLQAFLSSTIERVQSTDDRDGVGFYFRGMEQLFDALNGLLDRDDLYDETAWADTRLRGEARDLLDRGWDKLPADEHRRLNRLLIESIDPSLFQPRSAQSVKVKWLVWDSGESLGASVDDLRDLIEKFILPNMFRYFVGPVGIMIAVLVTAAMIPRLFDPGSINLILSKPVSRSLMFLSKYLGGCAFVLLNVTYLLAGLWLLFGLRLGIWSSGLLLCIPLFLFLFSIYYSVSAFAGIVWKSSVLSVIMVAVFWVVCVMVGTSKNTAESWYIDPERITSVCAADDALIGMNRGSQSIFSPDSGVKPLLWSASQNDWRPIFTGKPGEEIIWGPIYNPHRDQIVAIQAFKRPGMSRQFASGARLIVGRRDEGWQREVKENLPSETLGVFIESDGGVVVASVAGVMRYNESAAGAETPELIKTLRGLLGNSGPLELATDPDLRFPSPAAAAMNPQKDQIVVYSRGKLTSLVRDNQGDYQVAAETIINKDETAEALIAVGGNTILAADDAGLLKRIDAQTLQQQSQIELPEKTAPQLMLASPATQGFAILAPSRKLYLLDPDDSKLRKAGVLGQGNISAATYSEDGALVVVDRGVRATEYNAATMELRSQRAPPMSLLERAYYGPLIWFYWLFPKPLELNRTMDYVLSPEQTVAQTLGGDLQEARQMTHPWRPVYSSLLFVAFMLTVSCIYIERSEF